MPPKTYINLYSYTIAYAFFENQQIIKKKHHNKKNTP